MVRVASWHGRAALRPHGRTAHQIVRSARARETRRTYLLVLCRIVVLVLVRLRQRREPADLTKRLNPAWSEASISNRRPLIVWRSTICTAEATIGLCRTVTCGVVDSLKDLICILL